MAVDDGSRITASTAASGAAHHRILIPQIRPPLSSTKETQHNSTPTPAEQLQQHTTPHQTISPPHQPNPTQSKNTNDDEMTKRDGHRYRAEQAEAERSRERERERERNGREHRPGQPLRPLSIDPPLRNTPRRCKTAKRKKRKQLFFALPRHGCACLRCHPSITARATPSSPSSSLQIFPLYHSPRLDFSSLG